MRLVTVLLLTGVLACSQEKKTEQTADSQAPPAYEQIAAESAAIMNQLHTAANEINQVCPLQVDAATRLDSAEVLSDTELQFNYTLTTASREDVDLTQLQATTKPALVQSVKANSALADLRDHSITMVYNYRDMNGEYLLRIPITPTDYAK